MHLSGATIFPRRAQQVEQFVFESFRVRAFTLHGLHDRHIIQHLVDFSFAEMIQLEKQLLSVSESFAHHGLLFCYESDRRPEGQFRKGRISLFADDWCAARAQSFVSFLYEVSC
jgi:hypothetical protein